MSLKIWIEYADPSSLLALGDSWIAFGADLEHLFDRYVDAVTKVNDTYWEGQCAQAAQDRALADQKTMRTLADKINAVAQRTKNGYDEIDAPLRRARGALIEAGRRGYSVADTLALSIPPGKTVNDEDKQSLLDLQSELNDAVRSTVQADSKLRDDLNNARADLRAAFIASPAALGADQGKADGSNLTTQPVNLGADGMQRLIEAGQLTPDQIAALQRGELSTIPASQMEYLNGLSHSLDGKSPQEIQQIMSKLPPDGQRALANSLQIVSNPSINAGPVAADDKDLPNNGKGGLGQLPKQMQDSLTRSDLVTDKSKYGIGREVNLNGVADNQAIAKIVGAGDPQLRVGTDVDRKLLDVGAKYLDGYENYKNSDDFIHPSLQIDGADPSVAGQFGPRISEDMFAVAGTDKAAVEGLMTGPDHEKFMHNVFTHEWSDRGTAVSTLFQFDPQDAVVQDPNNPIDVKTAERTGHIMSSVGEYLAGGGDPNARWNELAKMDNHGINGHSIGQLNPTLVQEISKGMSPYVDVLAGTPRPELPGFDVPHHINSDGKISTWLDPQGNGSYKGAANIFGLMNTDPDPNGAGKTLNGAAMFGVLRNEGLYAHDPQLPGSTDSLATAGRLNALVDKGIFSASESNHSNNYADAQDMYDRKRTAYDEMKALTSRGLTETLPGGKYGGDILTGGGDNLKEFFTGAKPTESEVSAIAPPNFAQRSHEVLSQAQIPENLQSRYSDLFENGGLKSWESIQFDPKNEHLTTELNELFNKVGQNDDGHGATLRNAYSQVTLDVQSKGK